MKAHQLKPKRSDLMYRAAMLYSHTVRNCNLSSVKPLLVQLASKSSTQKA